MMDKWTKTATSNRRDRTVEGQSDDSSDLNVIVATETQSIRLDGLGRPRPDSPLPRDQPVR